MVVEKMRLLVIGAKGMAGHMISLYLKENTDWDIAHWSREDFEIINGEWKDKIVKLNDKAELEYIINCIGILKPVSKKNPVLAIKINSLFPHELAELATEINTKVIHLSSDCWKDLDTYGRSKRAGELNYPNHLTLRTSFIGPELKDNGCGLFHWFMSRKREADGFIKHFWDGVTTVELAKTIKTIIDKKPELSYIVDFRSKEKVNKFQLLNYIKKVFGKDIKINPTETDVVDRTNNNPEMVCEIPLLKQIEELKEWMTKHSDIYKQYGF